MSGCCATPGSHKLDCPNCQQPCSAVGVETLRYHLKQPWHGKPMSMRVTTSVTMQIVR